MNMPERIWAELDPQFEDAIDAWTEAEMPLDLRGSCTEYIRADLYAELNAENAILKMALEEAIDSASDWSGQLKNDEHKAHYYENRCKEIEAWKNVLKESDQ